MIIFKTSILTDRAKLSHFSTFLSFVPIRPCFSWKKGGKMTSMIAWWQLEFSFDIYSNIGILVAFKEHIKENFHCRDKSFLLHNMKYRNIIFFAPYLIRSTTSSPSIKAISIYTSYIPHNPTIFNTFFYSSFYLSAIALNKQS